tara:strand:+ start:170 stop:430 length:261 start_codon:yes stop_codon:yes gene_type:complete
MYKGMSKAQYVQLKKNDLRLDVNALATWVVELNDDLRFEFRAGGVDDININDIMRWTENELELRKKMADIDSDLSDLRMYLETGDE